MNIKIRFYNDPAGRYVGIKMPGLNETIDGVIVDLPDSHYRNQFAIAAMPLVYARHDNKLTALELAYESFRIADEMLRQSKKEETSHAK